MAPKSRSGRRYRFVNRDAGETGWKRTHAAADSLLGAFSGSFARALAEGRRHLPVEAMAQALRQGRPEIAIGAFDSHQFRGALERGLGPLMQKGFARGAAETANLLPDRVLKESLPKPEAERAALIASLTSSNPEAVRFAALALDVLASRLAQTTLAGIRAIIASALRGEIDMSQAGRQIAERLRLDVGLTPRQARALQNYERNLLKANPNLSEARLRELVNDRRMVMLEQRGMLIARTETLRAVHAGQNALWEQAILAGLLPAGVMRRWIVTPDSRLCNICAGNAGAKAAIGQTFPDGSYYPPSHPQCRCALVLVIPKPGSSWA